MTPKWLQDGPKMASWRVLGRPCLDWHEESICMAATLTACWLLTAVAVHVVLQIGNNDCVAHNGDYILLCIMVALAL